MKEKNMGQKTLSLTFNNLSPDDVKALLAAQAFCGAKPIEREKPKRGRPKLTTVVEDEEESEDEETEDEESEDQETDTGEGVEETEDEGEEEESEDGEEEESESVTFRQVKDAIDEHGDKKPKEMRALLLAFNIKSTQELKQKPKKWSAVLAKINATFGKKKKR